MNFEDLKEQFKAQWEQLVARITDTSSFQQLKERYEAMTPTAQTAVQAGAGHLVFLFVFSIPYSSYQIGSENLAAFEEKRNLIRELLKVHQEAQEVISPFPPSTAAEVQAKIEQALTSASVLPEQRIAFNPLGANESGPLIKSSLVDAVFDVKLNQLNLTQAVNLAGSFAKIPGVKIKDLNFTESSKDRRYLDVTYKLVALKSFAAAGGEMGGDVGADAGGEVQAPPPSRGAGSRGAVPPPPPPPPPPRGGNR